jgi:hypothetical protein
LFPHFLKAKIKLNNLKCYELKEVFTHKQYDSTYQRILNGARKKEGAGTLNQIAHNIGSPTLYNNLGGGCTLGNVMMKNYL